MQFKNMIRDALKHEYKEVMIRHDQPPEMILASGEQAPASLKARVWTEKKLHQVLSFLHRDDTDMVELAKQQGPVKARFSVPSHHSIYVISSVDESGLWIRFFLGEDAKHRFQVMFRSLSDKAKKADHRSVDSVSSVEKSSSANSSQDSHISSDHTDHVEIQSSFLDESSSDSLEPLESSVGVSEDQRQQSALSEQQFRDHVKRESVLHAQSSSHGLDVPDVEESLHSIPKEDQASASPSPIHIPDDPHEDADAISFSQISSQAHELRSHQLPARFSDDSDESDAAEDPFIESASSMGDQAQLEEEYAEGQSGSVVSADEDSLSSSPSQGNFLNEGFGDSSDDEPRLMEADSIGSHFQLDETSYVGEIAEQDLPSPPSSDDMADAFMDNTDHSKPESSALGSLSHQGLDRSSIISFDEYRPVQADEVEDDNKSLENEDYHQDSLKAFLYENIMDMEFATQNHESSDQDSSIPHLPQNLEQSFHFESLLAQCVADNHTALKAISYGVNHMKLVYYDPSSQSLRHQSLIGTQAQQIRQYLIQNLLDHSRRDWVSIPVQDDSSESSRAYFWISCDGSVTGVMSLNIRRIKHVSEPESLALLVGYHHKKIKNMNHKVTSEIQNCVQLIEAHEDQAHLVCVHSPSELYRAYLGYSLIEQLAQQESQSIQIKTLEPQGFFCCNETCYEPSFFASHESVSSRIRQFVDSSVRLSQNLRSVVFISGLADRDFREFISQDLGSMLDNGVTVILAVPNPSAYLSYKHMQQVLVSASGLSESPLSVMRYLRGFLGLKAGHSRFEPLIFEGGSLNEESVFRIIQAGPHMTSDQFYQICSIDSYESILCDQIQNQSLSFEQAYVLSSQPDYFLSLAEQRGIHPPALLDTSRSLPSAIPSPLAVQNLKAKEHSQQSDPDTTSTVA